MSCATSDADSLGRFLDLRRFSDGFLRLHDLQDISHLRQEEPPRLPQHMLSRGVRLGHGHQGVWHRAEAHLQRQQPVQPRLDLRLHDHHGRMHLDTNELL